MNAVGINGPGTEGSRDERDRGGEGEGRRGKQALPGFETPRPQRVSLMHAAWQT